jgi:nucleoside 2-deoxyribosyltransferase
LAPGYAGAYVRGLAKERIMLKVYLASQFSRQKELQNYRDELERTGIIVTSSWLDEESSDSDSTKFEKFAEADLYDIENCDVFVLFTGEPYSGTVKQIARGGRHVEFGYALSENKEIIIVGPLENIFHYLKELDVFSDWHSAFSYIIAMDIAAQRKSILEKLANV